MRDGDTIVALSSGAVPAGVAVIRLSGPDVPNILNGIAGGIPEPRRLTLRPIGADVVLDRGLIAYFPAPHSFTGEDCAELQVHGSPAGVRAILRLCTGLGARLAEAGEFTRRAFENGKLDLVEAQGLGDLIEAETENQRALAYVRMEGGLTRRVESWRERLLDLRAVIEAQLDFSDEGDVGELPQSFLTEAQALRGDIGSVLALRGQGRIIRSGFRVVLAGPPNAGKSSLLNALSQSDVAIVSDEAGTTRDLKEVPLDLEGQLIILIDSAGLRDTASKAEAIGVDRARQAMVQADLVLWLQAADQVAETKPEFTDVNQHLRPPVLIVGTKHDLGIVPGAQTSVSAATGEGLAELLTKILDASGARHVRAADVLVSHEQDRAALLAAFRELTEVESLLEQSELAAERLRGSSMALERLLGRIDAEAVLDRLFASFCIGK
ncbi:tRNA uridine-5-carboxymethylaminomethyl(34) synthesis GTPase MnmE [uncultured Devosia sp.]|uniref:tRNA uridine-5-carboxymethylaminomethyl(34) synthesis GTPase MnmE n=1 Tax=uncultured Devosia sp. TaxID=211434 RepID=UPI0035C95B73